MTGATTAAGAAAARAAAPTAARAPGIAAGGAPPGCAGRAGGCCVVFVLGGGWPWAGRPREGMPQVSYGEVMGCHGRQASCSDGCRQRSCSRRRLQQAPRLSSSRLLAAPPPPPPPHPPHPTHTHTHMPTPHPPTPPPRSLPTAANAGAAPPARPAAAGAGAPPGRARRAAAAPPAGEQGGQTGGGQRRSALQGYPTRLCFLAVWGGASGRAGHNGWSSVGWLMLGWRRCLEAVAGASNRASRLVPLASLFVV